MLLSKYQLTTSHPKTLSCPSFLLFFKDVCTSVVLSVLSVIFQLLPLMLFYILL